MLKKLTLHSSVGGGAYGQNIDSTGMVPPPNASPGEIASLDSSTKKWNKAKVLGNSISNDWYKPEEPLFANTYKAYGKANPVETEAGGQFLHFTQIVWKATTKVGCATTYCGSSMFAGSLNWFTVCNYASPGKSSVCCVFLLSLT